MSDATNLIINTVVNRYSQGKALKIRVMGDKRILRDNASSRNLNLLLMVNGVIRETKK